MSTPKRVIIFDRYIVSWSGHWMQYALDLAELYRGRSIKPIIVVNRLFGRGAFKARKEDVAKLKTQAKLVATLHQPAFYKKRHPYEKLHPPQPSGSDRVSRWFQKPGSLRPIIYFAISDFRNGEFKSPLQFIQFLTRQGWSRNIGAIGDAVAALFGAAVWMMSGRKFGKEFEEAVNKLGDAIPNKEKKEAKPKKAWQVVWERLTLLRKQESGYREAFERLNPGQDDEIVFQTAELQDLVAVERVVSKNARWRKAKIKLILRSPIWDREGNMLEPPEDTKLLRQTLIQLINEVPRLEMYADTEELIDQYETLGFRRVRLIPILLGEAVTLALDDQINRKVQPYPEGEALTVLRSGSAQREKGFLILPDVVKAAQIARRVEGARPFKFILQCTMLRFQRRWDVMHATINRLLWFNDGDVRLVRKEVTPKEYLDNLLASDVILSPNRSIPYLHGSTGTTIEAVRAGRPLVTMGENWGARQVRDLDMFVNHTLDFASKTGIAEFGDDCFVSDPVAFEGGWRSLAEHWRPFCHVSDWQIAFDIARRIEIEVPENSTELVVILDSSNPLRAGDIAKVGMQMHRSFESLHIDRAQKPVFEYADPTSPLPSWRYFSGGRHQSAAIWRLRPGTRAVRLGLVLLDRRSALDMIKLRVVVCSNSDRKLPMSAVSVMADTPFEVNEGMLEVARHINHYRDTARAAAVELRKFHSRESFWECFSGRAKRRMYPEELLSGIVDPDGETLANAAMEPVTVEGPRVGATKDLAAAGKHD